MPCAFAHYSLPFRPSWPEEPPDDVLSAQAFSTLLPSCLSQPPAPARRPGKCSCSSSSSASFSVSPSSIMDVVLEAHGAHGVTASVQQPQEDKDGGGGGGGHRRRRRSRAAEDQESASLTGRATSTSTAPPPPPPRRARRGQAATGGAGQEVGFVFN